MNKVKIPIVLLAIIALIAAALFVCFYSNPQWFVSPKYDREVELTYVLKVKNKTNKSMDLAKLSIYAPVKLTPTQYVSSIASTEKYDLILDELGNQKMIFQFSGFPPFAERYIRITTKVQIASAPNYSTRSEVKNFLKDSPLLDIHSEPVQKLSRELYRGDRSYPDTVFNWLVSNIQGLTYAIPDQGALYAIEQKSGDCSEYMYAFVSLLRSKQMPARGMAGFVLDDDAPRISVHAYHNWAEYHDRWKWQLVDVDRKVFKEQFSQYVAFMILALGESAEHVKSGTFIQADSDLQVELI